MNKSCFLKVYGYNISGNLNLNKAKIQKTDSKKGHHKL